MRTDREHSLYYLIKEGELNKDIELLRGALKDNWGDNSIMGYSVKTNSLPWSATLSAWAMPAQARLTTPCCSTD